MLTTVLSYYNFVGPHLDYGVVIFDKAYNNCFQQRLEFLQFKASLAKTGANKGLRSWEALSGAKIRFSRKFCVFYKIVKEPSPKYLFELITSNSNS